MPPMTAEDYGTPDDNLDELAQWALALIILLFVFFAVFGMLASRSPHLGRRTGRRH